MHSQREPNKVIAQPSVNQNQQSEMYMGLLNMSKKAGKNVKTPAARMMTMPKKRLDKPTWHSQGMAAKGLGPVWSQSVHQRGGVCAELA
mmetsp:Transcript_5379/g.9083  ORF Transcript_5379/g.9083 Transcript_5379/m.9083 type:complete len:89 (+) Transcript_5379:130-396(+)